jgi:aspartyl-tRNA(Asn)/glutamyl-tRNA(Gln) amidotransferase subunit A
VHTRPALAFSAGFPHGATPEVSGPKSELHDEAGPMHRAAIDLSAGRVTSRQLVESALAAVAAHNNELVALVEISAEQAMAEAERCDADVAAGRTRGVLHGLPISVKDVIDVAGVPTRAGSDAYFELPSLDAPSVARLRAAGAVLVGKASTHEFALGVTSPQSRNPHDPTRIPGGSSGGSAISVVTGMALGSLGTDTRASIRVPAALSGAVGLKPTIGRVPTGGVVSLSWTMDHVAPLAMTVGDAALLLDVLDPTGSCGRPFTAALGMPVRDLRVGVPEAPFAGCQTGVTRAVASALQLASELGCRVDNVARPDEADLELANAAGLVVSRCEAATIHRSFGLDRLRYWQEVAEQLEAAASIPAIDYLQAQRARLALADGLGELFSSCDVLAMPTVPIVAPPRDDFAAHLMTLSRNAIPWSFVGFPALSLPCGEVGGLPVGLQLVAAPYREDLLVALGSALEGALWAVS